MTIKTDLLEMRRCHRVALFFLLAGLSFLQPAWGTLRAAAHAAQSTSQWSAGPRRLRAAATKVDITPDLKAHRVYLAGFGATGRRPQGVHDPLYARILLMTDGKKTVAIVALDLLGIYRNDVEDLRRRAGFGTPDRYLFVAATHQHSGPDTLGLWGPVVGVSGVDPRYQEAVKEKVVSAIHGLFPRLQEVELSGFSAAIDPRGLCRDSRNPAVIDPYLGALSLKAGGRTLATLVNWSCHPEVLGGKNRLVTADYPGPLCERIEARTGGACLFLSGSIGGLMTPETREGRENFYEAYRIGTEVADRALEGLKHPGASSKDPALGFKSQVVRLPVENSRYLLFLPALTFGHRLLDSGGKPMPWWKKYWLAAKHALRRLKDSERPWIETEVSVLDIGPARILGMPGEIFPELVIGGYDGRYRFGHLLVDPKNPDPPDLSRAPKGPALRELIRRPIKFVVGLANDEIGYVVPEYDFKIQKNLSLLPRLPGHHYEETNSIGPSATGILLKASEALLSR